MHRLVRVIWSVQVKRMIRNKKQYNNNNNKKEREREKYIN